MPITVKVELTQLRLARLHHGGLSARSPQRRPGRISAPRPAIAEPQCRQHVQSRLNRGPDEAALHVLPTLWFRNRWSWGGDAPRPSLRRASAEAPVVQASEPELGELYLHCDGHRDGPAALLFTENETNAARLFGSPNATPFVKDGIHEFVVHRRTEAVNPDEAGTKAAA